jgi:hypothetical protein
MAYASIWLQPSQTGRQPISARWDIKPDKGFRPLIKTYNKPPKNQQDKIIRPVIFQKVVNFTLIKPVRPDWRLGRLH